MKTITRSLFLLLLGAALFHVGMIYLGPANHWLAGAGLLFDIAGIVQLEMSGLFDEIMKTYGDEKTYPYGPPSHVTRQIIDDPDAPIIMWLKNKLFFERRTGFELIFIGFLFQYVAIWF